ncbi:class I tRNA ligase family protein, partial [bacterium]|nr:class I tRNA ligase family protein [bacterium]
MSASKWKDSLCLPKTDFPMRGSLAKAEPKWLDFWAGADLYRRRREMRAGKGRFVLHDGPPYANGDIHVGTALNKILKDMVCRYAWQAGHDAPYRPGWDCHGLPIEHLVLRQLGGRVPAGMSVAAVRERCLALALGFMERQKTQFARLGVLADWESPYLTVDKGYEAAVLECFRLLVEAGLVERAKKAVHWSWAARTALAEAELEYRDREDPSIAVALVADPATLPPFLTTAAAGRGVALAIWTTTPWTLPANVAVAVDPPAHYSLVGGEDGPLLLISEARVRAWEERLGLLPALASLGGAALRGIKYSLPFGTGVGVVVAGGAVSMEEGTGLVHTAPGHGAEDYEIGKANSLPLPSPVDEDGRFLAAAEMAADLGVEEGALPADLAAVAGQHVFAANGTLQEALAARGTLLWAGVATHSYPHCWRTKEPVIFRATAQWFVKMDTPAPEGWTLRERTLAALPEASWVPSWGEARLAGMVAGRPDWCISRQRLWGIGIPAFADAETGEVLCTPEVVAAVRDRVAKDGSGVWFCDGVTAAELCPDEVRPPRWRGRELRRLEDIFDVWFESGSSHRAVLLADTGLGHPADLYLEGDLSLTLQLLTQAVNSNGAKGNGYAGNGGVWEKYRAISDGLADASPIDPRVLCNALNEAMPSDTIYIDETIVHRGQILRRINWDNPQSYLRPTGGLGQGLGTALGVKLASPDRPVVALMGDGSLLYNPITQALGVARESSLPIMIVVFNNASYAAMKNLHLSFYPDGDAAKSGIFHGVHIPGPDYQ